jgi:hypothetical protein
MNQQENYIYNVVVKHINKAEFTNDELKQLEKDFRNQVSSKLVTRYRDIIEDALRDEFIVNFVNTYYPNDSEIMPHYVTSNVNAIISEMIESIVFNIDNTSLSVAQYLVKRDFKLIEKDKYEKAPNSFLPLSLVKEYEEIISELNRDFIWNTTPELRLNLLSASYLNTKFNEWLNSPIKFFEKVINSKIFSVFFAIYCIIPSIIMSFIIIIYELIKAKVLIFNLSFFTELVIHRVSSFISRHYIIYYVGFIISATIINFYIKNLFFK